MKLFDELACSESNDEVSSKVRQILVSEECGVRSEVIAKIVKDYLTSQITKKMKEGTKINKDIFKEINLSIIQAKIPVKRIVGWTPMRNDEVQKMTNSEENPGNTKRKKISS